MGLSTAEFFELTHTEFETLRREHLEGERRADLRFGVVAAMVANVNRSREADRIWYPEDFVLGAPRETQEQSDEEMAARLISMWGGGRQNTE